MLSAYLDESGTHAGSEICVISGLVAPPVKWERLTISWGKVLQEVGIPDFHAADCASGGGIFRFGEWKNSERRERLYRRLVNLVVRTAAYRVWAVVIMRDYYSLFTSPKEKIPYAICATVCASHLRGIAVRRGPHFVIPCVFEQGDEGKRMMAAFSKLLKKGDPYRMGMLSKGDRRKTPPLQAADLCAYETYRYFADQLKPKPRIPERRSFTSLLDIADGGGCILTREKLLHIGREVVRQKREGKKEPINLTPDRMDSWNRIGLDVK